MNLRKLFIAFLALWPVVLLSQKQLTLEDASYLNPATMPKTLRGLDWRGEGDRFAYRDQDMIITGKAGSEGLDTIRPLPSINKELSVLGMNEIKAVPSLHWLGEDLFWFISGHSVFTYDLSSQELSRVNSYPENAKNIEVEGNGLHVAYTVRNNLFVAIEGEQIQVSHDQDTAIVSGQSVSRNEFGISKGTFWSPSGKYLAFYRKDERGVTDYPLVNINTPIATVDNIKYPMAGSTNEIVTLHIFDPEKNGQHVIKTGEGVDQYLTSVTWGPREDYIYTGLLNRDQNHLAVNKYDAMTGEPVKTLFEETDDKYVEPLNPLYFLPYDPGKFIWMSQRDGFNHLYLYSDEGELIRQLTRGEWIVTEYLGTGSKNHEAYFLGTKSGPLNNDLYSVDISSGQIMELSARHGDHSAVVHPAGKYILDHFSDTVTYAEYNVLNNRGDLLASLPAPKNPLNDYTLGRLSIFTLNATDGTVLYSRMIYPPDFDPTLKYPVIVYVYGGPHTQLITNTYLGRSQLFLYYMAQKGYIVFTLDNRGSANRGLAFEQAIFRNAGTREVEDQLAGISYLKSLDFVDTGRIGVNGWSYGGFMTISLMLRAPEVFRAGVCGGPVTDWKYYEIMYGERYMDTPESNPEGYERASLLNKTDQLQGDLLIIHDTYDPVVVWQNSLMIIKKFIGSRKQVDYFVYPDHGHGVGGKDRLHLNRKMEKYFDEHL